MTAHELARALLAGPDLPVVTIDDDEVPMAIVDACVGEIDDYERLGEVIELGTDPADDTPRR
jgi:hypothetical protein